MSLSLKKICDYLKQRDEEILQLHKKLKKTEELLDAYIEASNMSDHPISHTPCKSTEN